MPRSAPTERNDTVQYFAAVPADRLWVNPDCGLKTRGYAEVNPAREPRGRRVRAEQA